MPVFKFIAPMAATLALATIASAEPNVDSLSSERMDAIKVAFSAEDPKPSINLNDALTQERWAKMKHAYKTHDPESLRLAASQ